MGSYLSKPITKKISTHGIGKNVVFGASSMQGWRDSQEDAHNCCINFDRNASLFAVYDGHCGHEVALHCSQKLPQFIKETDAYKRSDVGQALIDAFLGFDATLKKPEIIKILKKYKVTVNKQVPSKVEAEVNVKNESSCNINDDDDDEAENKYISSKKPGSTSGCTAVVALLHGENLYVANAGDSRCVLCRDGKALELSLDHKPTDTEERKRIYKAGGVVTWQGRINGNLNLSRAIGDHKYKQNTELPPEDQMISALPDIKHILIDPKRDEFLILACDGIWNCMFSSEVVKFVKERINDAEDNISKVCEELFDHCLAPDSLGDGTGCDNMTAIIVKFKNSTQIPEIAGITLLTADYLHCI
ncbi:probable protein phosphatase CG10417 [Aphidius gifuensis]|uniref:probable protein phosphatase CG10417 n=1 Tax=Aphidius gifuensis TaxID=684658 RepID=UPI001CDB743A|nr:probable protein phosphatase CG10417 [Aphidius gifuensis]